MTQTLQEWIDKAAGDYATAHREILVEAVPNYDAVIFHAQQFVEKLMKAVLISRKVVPPKTHDLNYLDRLVVQACPEWSWSGDDLQSISGAAFECRYPAGRSYNRQEAQHLIELADAARGRLLALLDLHE